VLMWGDKDWVDGNLGIHEEAQKRTEIEFAEKCCPFSHQLLFVSVRAAASPVCAIESTLLGSDIPILGTLIVNQPVDSYTMRTCAKIHRHTLTRLK